MLRSYDIVKQYLKIAHPKNKFKFINVSKFMAKAQIS